MALTKPTQELWHDLKQAADLLKWSGVDLFKVATKLSEYGSGRRFSGAHENCGEHSGG
ncbi:hypothetical protein [Pseudomonas umsongensis]|uniref:hypothetical protein n=1 Tax=Pseudomonas umsongensis TaxID=198618 RepID=UPI0030B881A6